MKKIKYIGAYLTLVLLSTGGANAQQSTDEVIFGALKKEIERGMVGLKLPDYTTPHYIGYFVKDIRYAVIAASLGTILSDQYIPLERYVGAGIYTGTYELNSDAAYQPSYGFMRTAADDDPDQLRRDLWLMSDGMYKNAASMYQNKIASLNSQNITDPLPDMIRINPVTVIDHAPSFAADRDAMRTLAKELSMVFFEFPELYGTRVIVSAIRSVTYMANSEGSTIKQPVTVYAVSAAAGTATPEGTEIGSQFVEYYSDGFPPVDQIKDKLRNMALEAVGSAAAPATEEYYYGPVMYEGKAAVTAFISAFLSQHSLLAYRKPVDAQNAATTWVGRIGRKVVDTRLTVRNLNCLYEYGGVKLIGPYRVDAEGVIPPDEVTLIEKGLFRRTLNSRIPTEISGESTGSLRTGVTFGQGSMGVYPGILHINVTDGQSPDDLKAKLIERALEDGNDCAYIVRKLGNDPMLYRVDLETGEEGLVRNANVPVPVLNKLDRLLGISDKELVVNDMVNNSIPISIICPSALIVEGIEITPKEVKKEQLFFTVNPLQRK